MTKTKKQITFNQNFFSGSWIKRFRAWGFSLTKPFSVALLISFIAFGCDKSGDNPKPVETSSYTKAGDIPWAASKGFNLTMDIYTPDKTRASYPVIVIFHGGGWLINDKSIMTDMAQYLLQKSEYVVCNVNYRLLGDLNNTTTINEIIEDTFGAVLWIKENISKYKGDPSKIIITGDSAGGHLAAAVATQASQINDAGLTGTVPGFRPTYLPAGKTAEQIKKENGLAVQAAMLSYGVFDLYSKAYITESGANIFWAMAGKTPRGLFGAGINVDNHPDYYKLVSPVFNVPKASAVQLPPLFFSVGSKDDLVTPTLVEAYINQLKAAGHTNIEYWIHEGRPHAFLDRGTNTSLGISFEKDAKPALDKMITFLNKIFY